MHRLRRSHDGNALMLASQTMQMFVAGNDQVRVSGKSTGENMIVVGIVLDHTRHIHGRGHECETPQFPDDAFRCQAGQFQS